MKIACLGIEDLLPGKRKIFDQRVEDLAEIFHSAKTTHLSCDIVSEDQIKDADGIVAQASKKLDLVLTDLEIVEQKLMMEAEPKGLWQKAKDVLEKEQLLTEGLSPEELNQLKDFPLVTLKPIVFSDQDSKDYDTLIRKIFEKLNLIHFFTAGKNEARIWQIKKGLTAPEAAGKIHTDLERGFIKAEVMKMKDLFEYGHVNDLKSRGLFYLKEKDYVVEDEDMITFRFNV